MKSKSPKTTPKTPTPPGRTEVPGSHKKALAGAKLVGKIDPEERIEVTLRLRRRPATAEATEAVRATDETVSREQFAEMFGADPADIARIEDFAHDHGFEVLQSSVSQRMVRLAGPASSVKAAFGTTLKRFSLGKTRFRGRSGPLSLPTDIHALIEGVFGLDDRPQANPHFRPQAPSKKGVRPRAGALVTPLTPVQVAKIYNFPPGLNGSGQTIAIIELGGGYRTTDLNRYFASLGLTAPRISAISVSGGRNAPTGNPNGPDGEVMLDIEVAGAVAPGARIAVYFAPNTDAGFLNALTAAVHDNLRKPCVVSISWGASESNWTAQAMRNFDSACSDAALLGVTVCVAAGDHGSSDSDDTSVTRGNVDFPASSPHVLACGGTRLETNAGALTNETVWNNHDGWATGGGVSEVFPVPSFQSSVTIPNSINAGAPKGRGVPDVAGDADGETGYRVRVDGVNTVFGGTSAVAPLWAGLIAVLTQGKRRSLGFMTPKLYRFPAASQALRDIVTGDNNGYRAGPGWDACTGLGVPNGAKLLSVL